MTDSKVREDASFTFARHFVKSRYSDIPREVVEAVQKSILDTLGVSLAATTLAPAGSKLAEMARDMAGKEESTILAFGGKVPAPMAAFANGGLAHGLDYDDIHYEGVSHPSGVVLPAAFAVAERVGPTSGRDFITAVALGHDMVMRMTCALHTDILLYNWIRFPILGVFAAAAACGKLMKLDEKRMHEAIGAALCYAAATGELSRGNLRGLYCAWAGQGAVMAALMAEKGLTGPVQPLEGERGFFNTYYQGKYDRDLLLSDLGEKFYGIYLGYKAWPSCSNTHPSIDATLQVVKEHDIQPEDIEAITIRVGPYCKYQCEPLDFQCNPPTILDAKFSVPFTVALAAGRRRVTLKDFTAESLHDPLLLALTHKTTPVLDPQLDVQRGAPPAVAEIKTKAGKKYSRRVDYVYGHHRNPMKMEAVIQKFRDCLPYSARPIPRKNIDRVVELVKGLEQVADVGEIVRLL